VEQLKSRTAVAHVDWVAVNVPSRALSKIGFDCSGILLHNKLWNSDWNEWNIEHIARRGIPPEEAEHVVSSATRPFPRKIDDDKWLVWGRGSGGRVLQVVFVVDEDDLVFVIHARRLTEKEKRRFRRWNS
jgi:uncharacterized DUF497 family protein